MGVEAVFFDLDYTLYDQAEYMRGALRSVAEVVAREAPADGGVLTRSLLRLWQTLGTDHDRLFDDLAGAVRSLLAGEGREMRGRVPRASPRAPERCIRESTRRCGG